MEDGTTNKVSKKTLSLETNIVFQFKTIKSSNNVISLCLEAFPKPSLQLQKPTRTKTLYLQNILKCTVLKSNKKS